MTNERLIEITVELGKLYTTKRETTFKLWQVEKDTEGRKLNLTPPDGWPGKNEEQRRTAQGVAFEQDNALTALAADAFDTRKKLIELDDQIRMLENERRAIEWLIRSHLVSALSANQVDRNEGDVKDTAFDDAAQAAVDQAAFNPDIEQMQSSFLESAFSAPTDNILLPDDLPF